MLEPDGRATLTEQLRPPSGYQLARAIATTFTLDLTTALSVPLAFAAHRVRESRDPIAILDAVRRAANKIDVFAQAGQVFEPAVTSDLFALLEPMIHPARAPRTGALFHPKVWVLEYSDGEKRSYRMLCASRNLTNDRSWDLVVRLDGMATASPTKQSLPLAAFVRALPAMSIQPLAPDRAVRVSALADQIATVEWECPTDVRSVRFHPYGVPGVTTEVLHDLFDGYSHGIISPFITDHGIAGVVPPRSRSVTVLARREQLDRLDTSTLALIDAHILDDAANDEIAYAELSGEIVTEDSTTTRVHSSLIGLHAKAYVVDRHSGSHLFVGSANTTDAAFGGNVEMLVEFEGPQPKIGVNALLGTNSSLRSLTMSYEPLGNAEESTEEKADFALEQVVRALSVHRYHALVGREVASDLATENDSTIVSTVNATVPTASQPSNYYIRLTAKNTAEGNNPDAVPLPDGFSARVSLLTRPANAAAVPGAPAHFDRLSLTDITPFVVIRVTDDRGKQASTVVMAALEGDVEGRQDAVIARQLSDRASFMRLLSLLLAIDSGDGVFSFDRYGSGAGSGWEEDGSGIFETLVRAIGVEHGGLADVRRIIEHVRAAERERPAGSPTVLPKGFDELWQTVWAAHHPHEELGAR